MIINKKAKRDYEIKETLTAGISLTGQEVKSLRTGRGSLKDAYVKFMNGELWLLNADIPKYSHSSDQHYDNKRRRKLLITKKEMLSIQKKIEKRNLTIIPIKMFFKKRWVKLEIGIARGRKEYEKKEKKKRKDIDREIARTLKSINR